MNRQRDDHSAFKNSYSQPGAEAGKNNNFKQLIKTTFLETESNIKNKNSVIGTAMLFICILFGMTGLIFCLLDSFALVQVNYITIFTRIFIILIIYTILYFLPSKIFTTAGFVVLAGIVTLYVYQNLQKIIDAVYYTVNLCLFKIAEEGYVLGSVIDFSLARNENPNAAEYINITVFIAAFFFTTILSYLVYSRKNVLFSLFFSLVMIFPGFYYGLIPTYFSFTLVVAFWFSCFAVHIFDMQSISNLIDKQNRIPEKKLEKLKYSTFKKQYYSHIKKLKKDIRYIIKAPNRDENSITLQKLVRELEKITDKEKLFLQFYGLVKKEPKKKKADLTEINTGETVHTGKKGKKNVHIKKKKIVFTSPLKLEKMRLERERRAKKAEVQKQERLRKLEEKKKPLKRKIPEILKANFSNKVKISTKNGYAGFFAFLLSFATLFIVQPLIAPNAKLKTALPPSVQDFVENTIDYFFIGSNANVYGGYNGGMGGGYLYNKNGAQFRNKAILKLTAVNEGVIYLKGWTGNIYDGKMWQEADRRQTEAYKVLNDDVLKRVLHSNESQFFYLFTSNMQDITDASYQKKYAELKSQNVTIEHLVSGGKLTFLPYFYSRYSSSEFRFKKESDLKVSITNSFLKKPKYDVEFYRVDNVLDRAETPVFDMKNYLNYYFYQYQANMNSNVFSFDPEDESTVIRTNYPDKNFFEAETAYFDYADDYYLELPENLPPEIKTLAEEITLTCNTDYDKAIAIENYLATHNTYTLYPKAPQDPTKDFVYNFLFDTNEGYCTYYATSMVVMMRALGIPARYVEGYLVDTSVKQRGIDGFMYHTVYDYNGHAWPEIYLRGIGWLPFEPTTAVSDDAGNETPYTYTPPARIPGYDSMSMITYSEFLEEDIEIVTVNQLNTPFVKFFLISALIVMVILILNLANYIINENRLNYFKNAKTNDAVLKMFEHSLIFLRLCGYVMYNDEGIRHFADRVTNSYPILQGTRYNEITDIIQRARFSNHEISEKERLSVYDFIVALRKNSLFNMKILMRSKMKYYYFVL